MHTFNAQYIAIRFSVLNARRMLRNNIINVMVVALDVKLTFYTYLHQRQVKKQLACIKIAFYTLFEYFTQNGG